MASTSELLHRIPLFAAMDESATAELLRNCTARRYPAGRIIFLAGRPAEQFFVILEGQVKIYKLSQRGEEQTLHLYGPGETFGEAAMWAGISYPAHAETVAESLLLPVSRPALRRAITASPDLALEMLAGMSAKLHEFTVLIEHLSLREVPSRVAAALLAIRDRMGRDTFRLPVTKRQLAGQVGTTPETLSRSLAKLRKDGIIEVKGATIHVLQPEALGQAAEGMP